MSKGTGPVRKLQWDGGTLVLTNSIDIGFWQGGFVNTEAQEDVGGQTPLKEFKGGFLTGITSRCGEPGSLQLIMDLVTKTTEGDSDIIVTLANGEKYSAPCFAVVDVTEFFKSREGIATLALHPSGFKFSKV